MRIWSDLFSDLLICSPPAEGPMTGNQAPYLRQNIRWRWAPYSLAPGLRGRIKRLFQIPGLVFRALRTVRESDLVLVRSPGHFGLIGALLVRALRKPSITKWAGENGPYRGERLMSRIDRFVQGRPSPLHPVLVYGPPKRPHQIGFLPALMSREELTHAREAARPRKWAPPWNILSVGRLSGVKGFDLAIRALGVLRREAPGLPWRFTLVGEGPERKALEALAAACGIADRVTLTGALGFADVQKQYACAHVVIMPGTKEGWPKVIAEAWAHGAIPVAAASGLAPWILESGSAGVLFEPTAERLSEALSKLLSDPVAMQTLSEQVFGLVDSLSLEHFRFRLEQVLVERCGLA
jgi:glycosyltransferase involved in cell wall biosynthesis